MSTTLSTRMVTLQHQQVRGFLEGYVDGTLLLEGLKMGWSSARYREAGGWLGNPRNYDMGLGTLISFSQSEHQGLTQSMGYPARRPRALPTD